jgi:hypothetical protein
MPSALQSITADPAWFLDQVWGRRAHYFAGSAPALLSGAQFWDAVEFGLLTRPYVTAYRGDRRASLAGLTGTRPVLNQTLDGFVSAAGLRAAFDSGHTLELGELAHWHAPARTLTATLAEFAGARIEAVAVLAPAGSTGMPAHTSGAHLLIMQMEGEADWTAADPGPAAPSDAAFLPVDGLPGLAATIGPGDALYLPSGWTHATAARHGDSLHVEIRIQYPTTRDILAVLADELESQAEAADEFHSHHRFSPRAKSERVLAVVRAGLAGIDPDDLARRAADRRVRARP